MNVLAACSVMSAPPFPVAIFPSGARMLVIFDNEGKRLLADATTTNLVGALVAWRRATTAELRKKLLTQWKNGAPGTLQSSAAERLASMEKASAAAPVPTPVAVESSAAVEKWRAPDANWRRPSTARAAEARLATLWPLVREAAGDKLGRFAQIPLAECSQWASLMSAKEAAFQVRQAMRDLARDDEGASRELPCPAVLGALADLDALGNAAVWNASCSHSHDTLFAYLRAADGALVMAWILPEG